MAFAEGLFSFYKYFTEKEGFLRFVLYSVNTAFLNVLKDIADEERVHAGEFLRLLKELAPDEEKINKQSKGN